MIPDIILPAVPAKATHTSTEPCVFARVVISVESMMIAVPLIKPKFHPRPSTINAIVNQTRESPGAKAAINPAIDNVTPEAMTIHCTTDFID